MNRHVTLVLAGGRSRRFAAGKLNLRVGGVPLAAWVADRVRGWSGQACEEQWLSVAPGMHVPGSERFTRVMVDRIAFGGPLHAIAGVLAQLQPRDRLAVLATDMPAIARQDIATLAQRDAKIVMGCTKSKPTDSIRGLPRIQPLPSIWRGDALPIVREAIANGHHALHRLALRGDVACIEIESDQRWANINRVDDIQSVERWLGAAITCPSSKEYQTR